MHCRSNKKPRRIDNRLWKYRKIVNYDQKQIAALLGYENSSLVSGWEKGNILPCLKNALRLAHLLKTPVESLFSGLSSDLKEEVRVSERKLKAIILKSNKEDRTK